MRIICNTLIFRDLLCCHINTIWSIMQCAIYRLIFYSLLNSLFSHSILSIVSFFGQLRAYSYFYDHISCIYNILFVILFLCVLNLTNLNFVEYIILVSYPNCTYYYFNNYFQGHASLHNICFNNFQFNRFSPQNSLKKSLFKIQRLRNNKISYCSKIVCFSWFMPNGRIICSPCKFL